MLVLAVLRGLQKEYDDNKYIQFSANGKGACEAWLITPSVKIEDINKKVGFDVCIGYWNADCLSVLVSSDFDGKDVSKATWKDITSFLKFHRNQRVDMANLFLRDRMN